jgi:hypothetical protein
MQAQQEWGVDHEQMRRDETRAEKEIDQRRRGEEQTDRKEERHRGGAGEQE